MRTFFLLFIMAGLLSACGHSGERPATDSPADSMTNAHPNQRRAPLEEEAAALNVDGLFDDFIYTYMNDKQFQLDRTSFPLAYAKDGKNTRILRKDWKHNELFAHCDLYAMLFDNAAMMGREKDTLLSSVTVERIDFTQERVREYIFSKDKGRWMLTKIIEQDLSENVNSDFYSFYKKFSKGGDYQMNHIENPFEYRTYDSDNFQEEIEGVLDAAQWNDFAPALPDDVLVNINYNQPYADSRHRVMVITGQTAGLSCTLFFKKERGDWVLTRLECM